MNSWEPTWFRHGVCTSNVLEDQGNFWGLRSFEWQTVYRQAAAGKQSAVKLDTTSVLHTGRFLRVASNFYLQKSLATAWARPVVRFGRLVESNGRQVEFYGGLVVSIFRRSACRRLFNVRKNRLRDCPHTICKRATRRRSNFRTCSSSFYLKKSCSRFCRQKRSTFKILHSTL